VRTCVHADRKEGAALQVLRSSVPDGFLLAESAGQPMTEWRDIPGYEGLYQVSDDGQVKSLDLAAEPMKSGALSAVARLTPSTMPVCRVAPDLGLSRGRTPACAHHDDDHGQPGRSFHVADGTDFGSPKEELRLRVARSIICDTWQEAAEGC
jgi:hypothetical protein